MKTKAYRILINNGKKLHWSHLAKSLFSTDQINPLLGENLVDSLLLSDANFQKDRKGYWSVKEKADEAHSPYLDEATFTVVDVETTGGRPPLHRIIEIAGVKVVGGEITDQYNSLVDPGRYIPPFVARLTGISEESVAAMPPAEEVMADFLKFLGDSIFVAHNAAFDLAFVNHELQNLEMETMQNRVLCTQILAKKLMPELEKYSLDALSASLGIPIEGRHRALGDATATAHIFLSLLRRASLKGIESVQDLQQLQNGGSGINLYHMEDEWPLFADLPQRPGVYMMKDRSRKLLYVGKAKNIKERVKAHFYNRNRVSTRMVKMLEKVKKIKYKLTDTELSAILLESELIKKLQPRYNVDGRYSRSYPFLKVNVNNPYPRVYAVKEVLPDGALYFGPYKNKNHAKIIGEALNDLFKLRRCRTGIESIESNGQKEPCSYYDMKKCASPCSGKTSQAQYGRAVQRALKTLSKENGKLLRELNARHAEINEELKPPKAAEPKSKDK